MSPSLKQCFAYCSLVPKSTQRANLDMIMMWMALGIIPSSTGKMELEDIGKLHFRDLCDRSFFQYLDDAEKRFNVFQCFEMHDLIHDLATSIIQCEYSKISSRTKTIPNQEVRHLRIFLKDGHGQSILTNLHKLAKVRSIFVNYETAEKPNIEESFFSICISRLRYLRLFDLSYLSFKVLPSSIGTLKHLRYLDLSGNNKIQKLPDSICSLQSLQTLLLNGCSKLEEFPRDIGNLVSLRHLEITTKQTSFPENGIGRLRSLQLLVVSLCKNLRSLPHDIRFCATLRTLLIENCEQLELASGSSEVICELSLEKLIIGMLPQTTALPDWFQGAARTLQLIVIAKCPKLAALPEWLPKLTSLHTLVIGACPKLSSLPEGMQQLTSLTQLIIGDCYLLEERCRPGVGEDWPMIAHVPEWFIGDEAYDD